MVFGLLKVVYSKSYGGWWEIMLRDQEAKNNLNLGEWGGVLVENDKSVKKLKLQGGSCHKNSL